MTATAQPVASKGKLRACLLMAGFVALAGTTATLGMVWMDRQHVAVAHGFDDYFEQRRAAQAGYSDPVEFRRLETQRRVNAEISRRAKEIADRPQLACTAAQMAVKERLARPTAASFPYCSDWPGHVRAESPHSWIVTSWFDMADPSGIIRQRSYQVLVERGDDGNWRTFIHKMP